MKSEKTSSGYCIHSWILKTIAMDLSLSYCQIKVECSYLTTVQFWLFDSLLRLTQVSIVIISYNFSDLFPHGVRFIVQTIATPPYTNPSRYHSGRRRAMYHNNHLVSLWLYNESCIVSSILRSIFPIDYKYNAKCLCIEAPQASIAIKSTSSIKTKHTSNFIQQITTTHSSRPNFKCLPVTLPIPKSLQSPQSHQVQAQNPDSQVRLLVKSRIVTKILMSSRFV